MRRDLSGFSPTVGIPPPPPPPSAIPQAPAPPKRTAKAASSTKAAEDDGAARSSSKNAAAATQMPPERARPKAVRPGRHRVCVSLNVDIAEKLDLLARAHDCWKVEIVIRAAYACDPARLTDAAVSRFRARRGATITPYVMDLTPDELNRIDELAAATKLNRSAFVRRLIEAQDEPPPTTGTGVGPNDIDPSNIDRDI